jgi:hypothetical protein
MGGGAAGGPPGPLYALSTMMEDLPALRYITYTHLNPTISIVA